MQKPLKITLSLLAALFFLVLSSLIALPFFIDPNDFKPEIVAAVKEKTGRELQLPGDIKLSIFPWLGITTGKMVLNNLQGFQDRPWLTVEQSEIKVKLMPLWAKKIEVSRIVLKGANLNLLKNKQGRANWDDLTTQSAAKPQESTEISSPAIIAGVSLAALAIDGIAVEQAHIDWDNQESGKHFEVNQLNFNAGKFTFDQPVDVDVAFELVNTGVKQADSFTLTSKLVVASGFNHFQLTDVDLKLLREGEAVPGKSLNATLTAAAIAFDKAKQSVNISGAKLNSGEINISAELSGEHVIDKPSLQGTVAIAPFNPAKAMKNLNMTLPAMQDANALSKLAMNFNLSATAESVAIENLVSQLDDSLIKGSVSIKDFAKPAIRVNLAVDAIDADRYLPPKMKSEKPLASPAVALAAGASKLPAAMLRKLNANGELLLTTLKIGGLTMRDMHLTLSAKNGIVTTQQSINQFYHGSYDGNLRLDLRKDQTVLSLNEKFNRVQIESLLKDYRGKARMSGIVDASAQLQGQGGNAKALKSSLNGEFDFLLKNGAIKGLNLQKIIDAGKSLAKGETPETGYASDQTDFSEIKGTANLFGGILQNNDLVAKAEKFRVDGNGSANLISDSLDYKMVTRLVKKTATPAEPEQFHSTPIVINVGGSFDQPTYKLDVAALLTDKNKAKIEKLLDKNKGKINKLLDKLDKKLGPGAGDFLKSIL